MAATVSALPARIGEHLLEHRVITTEQVQLALQEQRLHGGLLGHNIVRLGFLTERQLAQILARMAGLPFVEAEALIPAENALNLLPVSFIRKHGCLPLSVQGDIAHVALSDPFDVLRIDAIRRKLLPRYDLSLSVAAASDIAEAQASLSALDDFSDQLLQGEESYLAGQSGQWQPSVVRFVDDLLVDAVRSGASDVHLEPEANLVRLRYRIDGLLQTRRTLHKSSWPEILYRLKIMAGMNIAETRRMQDGRFSQVVGGAAIDFRVSTMPIAIARQGIEETGDIDNSAGENIVIRILDQKRGQIALDRLGFSDLVQSGLRSAAQRPDGLVLLTGPTGCGKTTTLTALLRHLGQQPLNIMTLEEPVEYVVDQARQTQVNSASGLSFSDGVRGILRQDPDVILIGEIRDADTAQMALRAAMTGHRVFSTLHCRDSFGAWPRLMDLGLTASAVVGHLSAVMAQRLVPSLCPNCKSQAVLSGDDYRFLDQLSCVDPADLYEASGCPHCRFTGVKGRVAIGEILPITAEIEDLFCRNAPYIDKLSAARRAGFRSMLDDACDHLRAGRLSLQSIRNTIPVAGEGAVL